jgi:hypothetical protein
LYLKKEQGEKEKIGQSQAFTIILFQELKRCHKTYPTSPIT